MGEGSQARIAVPYLEGSLVTERQCLPGISSVKRRSAEFRAFFAMPINPFIR
ncbi:MULTISPECIES: hypothetical protein [Parageobacillus]|uniref:hypothetical protein n=1 Tax=Parageobacillus TaxID=1906945 RepID=UPI0012FD38F0|nr:MULTISPECIES: hypothetical protein [Parageobacillus]